MATPKKKVPVAKAKAAAKVVSKKIEKVEDAYAGLDEEVSTTISPHDADTPPKRTEAEIKSDLGIKPKVEKDPPHPPGQFK